MEKSLSKLIKHKTLTQIVYAPSVNKSYIEIIKKKFNDIKIQDLKSFLFSFIQNRMNVYQTKLRDLEPEYFIDPKYETPSATPRKIPNPVLSFLTDKDSSLDEGIISILLAEPGQGKTYTTRYLTTKLINSNYIPLYIHSPQWKDMREDDLSSLYKTIVNSFKYFDTPIDWIENNEKEFIDICLKLGVFRIIFDGFDEYILWNKGKDTADEVINNIKKLVDGTKTRILITSRTTFWKSNITENNIKDKVLEYKINPFDKNSAKNYFKKRFEKNVDYQKKAEKIFTNLINASKSKFTNSFIGRGFILSLIADLADGNESYSEYDGNTSVMQWLLNASCEREIARQKLPISANEQIEMLQLFVEYKYSGEKPDNELLTFCVKYVNNKISENDINNLIGNTKVTGSLNDHPLIYQDRKDKLWKFNYEQVEYNLLANNILKKLKNKKQKPIHQFFKNIKLLGNLIDDLSIVIFEQEFENIENIVKTLIENVPEINKNIDKFNPQLNLITNLSLRYLRKKSPKGTPKKDRTNKFLKIINVNDKKINNLHFTGTIQSIDFSNITFNNCRFENVAFANCKFNEFTNFINCNIIGCKEYNCDKFGAVNFEKCTLDNDTEVIIKYKKDKYLDKAISQKDIKEHILMFIYKFVPRDGVFSTVYSNYLDNGPISFLAHKEVLIDAMKKNIIEEHIISSTSTGYNIRKAAKHDIQNYMTNRVFSGTLLQVHKEICKKLKIIQ